MKQVQTMPTSATGSYLVTSEISPALFRLAYRIVVLLDLSEDHVADGCVAAPP